MIQRILCAGGYSVEKKQQTRRAEKAPLGTMRTAEQLLKEGNTDMAAVYFWYAANKFEKIGEYELSGSAYEKAAYCYELDGRLDKAAEEYLSASKVYDRAGLPIKAKAMKNNADHMYACEK